MHAEEANIRTFATCSSGMRNINSLAMGDFGESDDMTAAPFVTTCYLPRALALAEHQAARNDASGRSCRTQVPRTATARISLTPVVKDDDGS